MGKEKVMSKLKFIDLFAGIGGIRLGLEQAGMECAGFVEIDKFARESYQAEFDTGNEWTAIDIRSVSDQDWQTFRGKVDVIAGGFPCQTFSIAGKRKAFTDTTKGTLFFEVARAIENIRPSYFILENVKGLLSSKTYIPFQDAMTILNDELGTRNLQSEQNFPKKEWNYFLDNLTVLIKNSVENGKIKEQELFKKDPISWVDDLLTKKMATMRTQQQVFPAFYATSSEYDITQMIQSITCKELPQLAILKNLIHQDQTLYLNKTLYQSISIIPSLIFLKRHPTVLRDCAKKINSAESDYYVQTFNIIISALSKLGYDPEWRVFNSKDFGVPQNRERIIIVGSLRKGCSRKILSLKGTGQQVNPATIKDITSPFNSRRGRRGAVLADSGLSSALAATDYKLPKQVAINSDKLFVGNPNKVKQIGNLSTSKSFGGNPQAGRVYDPTGISPTLNTMQGGDRQPKIIQNAHGFNNGGIHKLAPTLTRSSYEMNNFVLEDSVAPLSVRKLTPLECWRLQGFPDSFFYKAKQAGISNSQLYKQAGNSVTVPLFRFIGNLVEDHQNLEKIR